MNVERPTASKVGLLIEPKIAMDAIMVTAITSTDHTDDSKPREIPLRMSVAGPVSAAFLTSLTGAAWVPVKYSVSRSITIASNTPTPTAMGNRHQPPHCAIAGVFK